MSKFLPSAVGFDYYKEEEINKLWSIKSIALEPEWLCDLEVIYRERFLVGLIK
jgi:hypothetical protein